MAKVMASPESEPSSSPTTNSGQGESPVAQRYSPATAASRAAMARTAYPISRHTAPPL